MKNSNPENKINVVETVLQQQFKMVSLKDINTAFVEVEQKRSDWLTSAIMFGIKTMYAKLQMQHGDLTEFLIKAISSDKKSIQTARRYVYLAGKVMEQIARPQEDNEIGFRVIAYFAKNKIKPENFQSLFSTGSSLNDILKFILDGLSMRGLTKALQAIDFQLSIEEKVANASDKEIPEEQKKAVQLSFEEELFEPIGTIQKLIRTDSFADLPKETALQFADALIAEGQALKHKLTR